MMIDLNKVRENLEEYKRVCKLKSKNVDVDLILEFDSKRKSMQAEIDTLKFQQKELAAKQDYE
jgi:seryl-tRNA synthetase